MKLMGMNKVSRMRVFPIPISARKQLNELSDDMVMKLCILYYADAREALLKALGDCSRRPR
jgi:hypothetical protein